MFPYFAAEQHIARHTRTKQSSARAFGMRTSDDDARQRYDVNKQCEHESKRADKVEARVAVILGDNEVQNGTVAIKDLKSTEQVEVARAEAAAKIAAILAQ